MRDFNLANTEGGWPEYVPLLEGDPDPPVFPVEMLPKPGREMVKAVAETLVVDPALPCTFLLGNYAVSLQRYVTIQAKSLKEETALWIVAIAGVSERKSATCGLMLPPVIEFERAQREAEQSMCEEEGRPYPTLFVEDATEEALSKLMRENGERIAIISDEPLLFSLMSGGKDKRPVLESMLKGYSGGTIKVNRITRESIVIYRSQLSVAIASQPSALRSFLDNKELEGRGAHSRFLYCPCRNYAGTGKRGYLQDPIAPEISECYHNHITALLLDAQKRERRLTLWGDATEMFEKYYSALDRMQGPDGVFSDDPWAGKHAGRTLRLAAYLHCAENLKTDRVSAGTMERAVRLSEYFTEAYLYAKGMTSAYEEREKLRKLFYRMNSQGKPILEFRDIQRLRPLGYELRHAAPIREYLRKLEEEGAVRKYCDSPESYMLNPYYTKKGWNH